MTSSTRSSLQQLQPAALISEMAQAVFLVKGTVKQPQLLIQQRDLMKCRLYEINPLQKLDLLTLSRFVSIKFSQPAAVKHNSNISVKVNLKTFTTSCFGKNLEVLSQIIQLVSAICQIVNWLWQIFIKSAGTLTATLDAQTIRENIEEQLAQGERHFWECCMIQPIQTQLKCSQISFFNQSKFNPDGKNHPKDTLRLFGRYRKLSRRGNAAFCIKRIFSRK